MIIFSRGSLHSSRVIFFTASTIMLTIKRIDEMTAEEISLLKDVLRDYGRFMYEDLGLIAGKDSFAQEIDAFPGSKYVAPGGTFFLALYSNKPAGCIGLRKFDDTSCEMKRMFVRPGYRGLGIGMKLCNIFLETAKQFGYRKVLLDTNKEMPEAVHIYYKLGFVTIPAYCENENRNPLYFMKML